MAITIEQLKAVLGVYGIKAAENWSEETFKMLAAELAADECRLEITKNGIKRMVDGVSLQIREEIPSDQPIVPLGNQYYLLEHYRIYPDGRRVETRRPPSGKVRADETRQAAVRRELKEKLGLDEGDYSIFDFLRTDRGVRESISYPGLFGEYRIHLFEVWLTPAAKAKIPNGYTINDKGVKVTFCWSRQGPVIKGGQ